MLEARGELDNTVFVVAGDHGYFYGEHGLGGERRLAYEESARIPLMIRYPPLSAPGTTPEPLVMNLDLAPTVLDLFGVPVPGYMQGRPLFEERIAGAPKSGAAEPPAKVHA